MKKIFILSLIFLLLFSIFIPFAKAEVAPTKKILAIIASSNFRDDELLVPKKVFEEEGFKIVIASSSLKPSRGMLGAEVTPDILLEAINVDDYDAIIFIGGPGSSEYFDNPIAHRIAQDSVKKNKVLAAICIAPVTLANAGVLSGKKATVWPSEANSLIGAGAFYTGSAVEIDGEIITANGPSAASDFAQAILGAIGEK